VVYYAIGLIYKVKKGNLAVTEMVFQIMIPNAEPGISLRMHRKNSELPPEHETKLLAIWISDHHKDLNLRLFFSFTLCIRHSSHD